MRQFLLLLFFNRNLSSVSTSVFSPGFFEGVVGGGAGIRARRWEK